MQRNDNIKRLQTEEFDLCIIGGGASGAGCALDAALRGLKVALVEKTDFAAETSSRSTKLVHGGVRYLEQAFKKLDFAQLRQVRHGLEERHIVLQNAPHLAHPLGLITPVSNWWEGLYFFLGLRLYDLFAAKKDNLPASRWLSKKSLLQVMPGISPDTHSAVLYFDGQLDDARYCLALVQSAEVAGAVVGNHLEVVGFQKDTQGKIASATINDNAVEVQTTPFTLRAKLFLNCCGPYADNIRQLANHQLLPRITPSKGVHLVLPLRYFNSEHAMLIPKTKDGRVVFAIPFEGSLLLGTTDEPCSDLKNEPVLEADEVEFLLKTLQPFVSETINRSEIKAGFGGLRPLVSSSSNHSTTKTLLRDHIVEHDKFSGLISLLGGKWTTYRLMAKDAIDFVCHQLGNSKKCPTATHSLYGAKGFEKDLWKKLTTTYHFEEDVSQHLAAKYGTNAAAIGKLAAAIPELGERIIPEYPYLKAEVVYAAKAEMVLEIRDFLSRRIRLESINWEAAKAATPEVARLLAGELGWSADKQKAAADSYIELIEIFQKRAGFSRKHYKK